MLLVLIHILPYVKEPFINVNIFTSVQTIHFWGERGVCENQHFFYTLLTFWSDFYYFHGHSKNVDVYSFLGGGGLRKCMVCTLMKMLTFMDGPYTKKKEEENGQRKEKNKNI